MDRGIVIVINNIVNNWICDILRDNRWIRWGRDSQTKSHSSMPHPEQPKVDCNYPEVAMPSGSRIRSNLREWSAWWSTSTPESLSNSRPTYFKRKFPRCVSIFYCFKIGIERFKHLLARCSTYSYYKARNTIKYLISITPRGAISFISQGYGGRCSDVQITLDPKNQTDEKFFDNIKEGDEILADRGWLGPLLGQELKRRKAILTTPAFLGRRSQLTGHETVFSRKVSNVRIHVERVIGKLRQTYTILKNKVPVNLLRADEDNIALFDKIVYVCCCLHNANPSVVPGS